MRSNVPTLSAPAHTLLAAVALTLMSPYAPRAQSPQNTRDVRRTEMENRQRALRELDKLNDRPPARAVNKRPLYRDVAEDFKQLQLSNYSLTQAARPDGRLDYALIEKEAAEVGKRASSLKAYLSLPKLEEGSRRDGWEKVITPEGLRSALSSLDTLVRSFVGNPYFRRPDVADLRLTSKASRDLTGIIFLSERVRRCADGLADGAGKGKK